MPSGSLMLTKKMKNKGFTLIELIIAVFVVTVGVVFVYGIIQQIISYTLISNSRFVAAYLAQEGIEIIRNIRDNNWVAGEDWSQNLINGNPPGFTGCNPGGPPAKYCEADFMDTFLTERPVALDPNFLRLQGQFYQYDPNGVQTKFKRKIEIVPVDVDVDGAYDKLNVSVEVLWNDKGKDYNVEIAEELWNWR